MLLPPATDLPLDPAALHVEDRGAGHAEGPALDHGEKPAEESEDEKRPAERQEGDPDRSRTAADEPAGRGPRHGRFFGKIPRRAFRAISLAGSGKSPRIIQSR